MTIQFTFLTNEYFDSIQEYFDILEIEDKKYDELTERYKRLIA